MIHQDEARVREAEFVGAPADNLEGVRSAISQLHRLPSAASWEMDYERDADTLTFRFPGRRPERAISYFLPGKPQIIFLLDATTGELAGVDLERFKSQLAKDFPVFADLYRSWRISRLLARIPLAARLGTLVAQAMAERTSDEVAATSTRLCPTA